MKTSLFRASVFVFGILIAAKVLNFGRKILIGKLFGVSWIADSFFAASYLPYYVAIFFEGIIFLSFLPLFSRAVAEGGSERGRRFAGEIFAGIFLATGALTLIAYGLSPWIVENLVPGFSLAKKDLTVELFRILTLVVFLSSLTSFAKALNSHYEHYTLAASSTLSESVVAIAVMVIFWKAWGIHAAAWGCVLGVLAAFILQGIPLLGKHAIFPEKLGFQAEGIRELFRFLIPMMGIWLFQQGPLVILNRFGSGMWEGTISSLVLAQTLTTVPAWLVSHTVLCAVFPSLAKQANSESEDGAKETFFQTLRGAFFLLIPVGFFLTGFARPLAILFFDGGGSSAEGMRRIANSLACFGWATFAFYADLFMTQSLVAVRKMRVAILLAASRALLTYCLGYILSTWWDYRGLALSFSLALAVNLFAVFPVFFRWTPLRGGWKNLFAHSLRVMLASGPLIALGFFMHQWPLTAWMEFNHGMIFLILMAGLGAGAGFYLFLSSRLQIPEMRSVSAELRKTGGLREWLFAEETG